MRIHGMRASEIEFAEQCTLAEGWLTETREEFEGFYAFDPDGCFVIESDGRPIGIGVATAYGESGFVGELIVLPEFRSGGVGRKLVDHVVEYLSRRGCRSIYLDGVQKAVGLYERGGFRKICRSLRYAGKIEGRLHESVRPMTAMDLDAVSGLDRNAFGADRAFFLRRRLELHPDLCRIHEDQGRVLGYMFGRRRGSTLSIGPWYVEEETDNPTALVEAIAADNPESSVALGVLESNQRALALLKSLGMTEHPEPPWRMVKGASERLGQSDRLFAIGTPAKG